MIEVDGRRLINFSSTDYLGLASDERLRAGAEAAMRDGVGAGASRLISGNLAMAAELERAIAGAMGAPAACLFNSGYAANVGLMSVIAGPDDVVFSDELNHASI